MAQKCLYTTQVQRDTIDELCKRLAEQDYLILPVARRFRRSAHDRIVAPRFMPSGLFFVRPERDGSISVRPYFTNIPKTKVLDVIHALRSRSSAPIIWSDKELTFMPKDRLYWSMLISREGREEVRKFAIAA